MHSSNTFITRLGLYNHVVSMTSLAWHCRELLQQPLWLNIEIHKTWLIQLTSNYHTKNSYRWRCI